PLLVTHMAAYGCVASIGVFLYMIDHVGKMLRPSGVFASVASEAHRVIDKVYPRRLIDPSPAITQSSEWFDRESARVVTSARGGVVLAFDERGLVALAARYDCVIELAPQVGQFVAPGDPLFRVHGGAAIPISTLRHTIAIGAERTLEQDPAFGF